MVNFSAIRITMILVSCLSFLFAGAAFSDNTIKVKTGVNLERDGKKKLNLSVSITNDDVEPLLVYDSSLPWGTRTSLLLIAVKAGPRQENIKEALFIDDPKTGETVINPGDSVRGKIDLTRRFPEIEYVLETHDVIVFWSYRLVTKDGKMADRISGGFSIPKSEN